LQRLQWLAFIAKLAIVIVFDDKSVGPARPLQQRKTPLQRQHGAGGKLVRRRDQRQSCPARHAVQVDTVGVYRHRVHAQARCEQHLSHAVILRVFDGNRIAGIQ
jgi:hypothetical protein